MTNILQVKISRSMVVSTWLHTWIKWNWLLWYFSYRPSTFLYAQHKPNISN